MRKLPQRGWGPFKQEFHSILSNPKMQEADTEHKIGVWQNIWIGKLSSFIYKHNPSLWRFIANFRPVRYYLFSGLKKFFPNLK